MVAGFVDRSSRRRINSQMRFMGAVKLRAQLNYQAKIFFTNKPERSHSHTPLYVFSIYFQISLHTKTQQSFPHSNSSFRVCFSRPNTISLSLCGTLSPLETEQHAPGFAFIGSSCLYSDFLMYIYIYLFIKKIHYVCLLIIINSGSINNMNELLIKNLDFKLF